MTKEPLKYRKSDTPEYWRHQLKTNVNLNDLCAQIIIKEKIAELEKRRADRHVDREVNN